MSVSCHELSVGQIIEIHSLRTMNVCATFHCNRICNNFMFLCTVKSTKECHTLLIIFTHVINDVLILRPSSGIM